MVPQAAQFLHVAEQHGRVSLWFKCETGNPLAMRRIRVIGTGNAIPEKGALVYIGTFMMHGGDFVWHVFEDRGG